MTTNPYTVEPRKEAPMAYLFWFFLAPFGAHRFYLNRKTTAWWQLGLTLSLVGMIVSVPWSVFVDPFLIPRMVREENARLAQDWDKRQYAEPVEKPYVWPEAIRKDFQ